MADIDLSLTRRAALVGLASVLQARVAFAGEGYPAAAGGPRPVRLGAE